MLIRFFGNAFTVISNVYIVNLHNRYRMHFGFYRQARIVYRKCSEIKKKRKKAKTVIVLSVIIVLSIVPLQQIRPR